MKSGYKFEIIEEPEALKTSALEDINNLNSEYKYIEQQQTEKEIVTQGHPHAELMAIAAEIAKNKINWQEDFQFKYIIDGKENWCQMLPKTTFDCHIQYRLKPRTIKIGNREINAPEREPLTYGVGYCCPQLDDDSVDKKHRKYSIIMWKDTEYDNYRLKNGLVFLNKEDAIAATEAMLDLLRGGE